MRQRSHSRATIVLAATLSGCCFGGATTGSPPPPPGTGTSPAVAGSTITLGPGFLPDPQTATGVAGGPVAAQTMNPACRGYIASAPSHVLNATGPFANLRIIVSSAVDTTLVVQRADGTFLCNDDSEGLNPIVAGPFAAGQHRIWVGTYSPTPAGPANYTLGFTELPTVTAASLGGGPIGGLGALGALLIPQDCGQSVPMYGPLTVGASIVLGAHTPWTGSDGHGGTVTLDANWAPEMAQYVGQRTTITQLAGVDAAGCPGVRVAIDNGTYFWRIRNVTF